MNYTKKLEQLSDALNKLDYKKAFDLSNYIYMNCHLDDIDVHFQDAMFKILRDMFEINSILHRDRDISNEILDNINKKKYKGL